MDFSHDCRRWIRRLDGQALGVVVEVFSVANVVLATNAHRQSMRAREIRCRRCGKCDFRSWAEMWNTYRLREGRDVDDSDGEVSKWLCSNELTEIT